MKLRHRWNAGAYAREMGLLQRSVTGPGAAAVGSRWMQGGMQLVVQRLRTQGPLDTGRLHNAAAQAHNQFNRHLFGLLPPSTVIEFPLRTSRWRAMQERIFEAQVRSAEEQVQRLERALHKAEEKAEIWRDIVAKPPKTGTHGERHAVAARAAARVGELLEAIKTAKAVRDRALEQLAVMDAAPSEGLVIIGGRKRATTGDVRIKKTNLARAIVKTYGGRAVVSVSGTRAEMTFVNLEPHASIVERRQGRPVGGTLRQYATGPLGARNASLALTAVQRALGAQSAKGAA